jgi:hypothetical protein
MQQARSQQANAAGRRGEPPVGGRRKSH